MKLTVACLLWISVSLFETAMGASDIPAGTMPSTPRNPDTLDTLTKMLKVVALARRQMNISNEATAKIQKAETEGMSNATIIKTIERCFVNWGIPKSIIKDILPEDDGKREGALNLFRQGHQGTAKQCLKVLLGDYFVRFIDDTDKTKLQMWAKAAASGHLEHLKEIHKAAAAEGYSELVLNFPIMRYLEILHSGSKRLDITEFLKTLASAADNANNVESHTDKRQVIGESKENAIMIDSDSDEKEVYKPSNSPLSGPEGEKKDAPQPSLDQSRIEPHPQNNATVSDKSTFEPASNSLTPAPKIVARPSEMPASFALAQPPVQNVQDTTVIDHTTLSDFLREAEKLALPTRKMTQGSEKAAPNAGVIAPPSGTKERRKSSGDRLPSREPLPVDPKAYWAAELSKPFKEILAKKNWSFWNEENARKAIDFKMSNGTVITDGTLPEMDQNDRLVLTYLLNTLPEDQKIQKDIAEVASRLYLNLLGVTTNNIRGLGDVEPRTFEIVREAKSDGIEKRIRILMFNNIGLANVISSSNQDPITAEQFLTWMHTCRDAACTNVILMTSQYKSYGKTISNFIKHFPFADTLARRFHFNENDQHATRKIVMGFIGLSKNGNFNKVAAAIPDYVCDAIVTKFYENMPVYCTKGNGCDSDQENYIKKLRDHMLQAVNGRICEFAKNSNNDKINQLLATLAPNDRNEFELLEKAITEGCQELEHKVLSKLDQKLQAVSESHRKNSVNVTDPTAYWESQLSKPFNDLLVKYGRSFWDATKARGAMEFEKLKGEVVNTFYTLSEMNKDDRIVLTYLFNTFLDAPEIQKDIAEVASRLYLSLLGVATDNVSRLENTGPEKYFLVKLLITWPIEQRIRALMLNSVNLPLNVNPGSGLQQIPVELFLTLVYGCQNATFENLKKMERSYNEGGAITRKFIQHFPFADTIAEYFHFEENDTNAAKAIIMGLYELNGNSRFNKVAVAIPESEYNVILAKFYKDIPEFCTLRNGCGNNKDQHITDVQYHMLRAVTSYLYDLLQDDGAKSTKLKKEFKFKDSTSRGQFWELVRTQYKSDRLPTPAIAENLQMLLQ